MLICEGAFDALALMAAGAPRVVAIFGVNGWRRDWAKDARELDFALDSDDAGAKGFRELAPAALMHGKRVAYLEPAAYGGAKDAAAAWSAGVLELGEWKPLFPRDRAMLSPEASEWPQPQELANEPEPTPGPSSAPMDWSAALERCERLDVVTKMSADEMSCGYLLIGGPAWMASLETELRGDVARLDAGDELPESLAKCIFAWKNATYILRNRDVVTGDAVAILPSREMNDRLSPRITLRRPSSSNLFLISRPKIY